MQLRPTRSPFFPYTTLFRSRMKGVDETGANGIAVADGKALRPLPVAWGLRQNEVVNVERRRGLEVINEITSIEIMPGAKHVVYAADFLVFIIDRRQNILQ